MEKNTEISERIEEMLIYLGINRNSFAQNIGYERSQTLYDIISGKSKPSYDFFLKFSISEYSEIININWLINGRGSMLKQNKEYEVEKDSSLIISEPKVSRYNLKTDYYGVDRQSIPLYELDASAGLNTLFSTQNTQVPLDYITVPNAPKCDGALFVRGDSMYPILKAGDIICYKTILNLDNLIYGEMYVLDIDNGDDEFLTVKFVKKSDKGDKYVTLVSENKHHADKDVPLKQIRALAIIKLSIRYNTIS